MRKNIFTLIELMIVTVIIFILCVMLFPGFVKVRNKAKSLNCMMNGKNIELGTLRYALDHNGSFVPYRTTAGLSVWNWAWGLKDDKYVKKDAYRCDMAVPVLNWSLTYGKDDIWHHDTPAYYYYIAYGYNFYYIGGTGSTITNDVSLRYIPARANQIKHPSGTVAYSDVYNGGNGAFHLFVPDHRNSALAIHDRHQGGANNIFIDGHVEWMRGSRCKIQNKQDHSLMDRE